MRNASARRNNNSFIPMKYITSTHHDRDLLKRGEIILSLSLCCCCNCFYSRSNSSLLLYFPAFSPIQRLKPCHSNPHTHAYTQPRLTNTLTRCTMALLVGQMHLMSFVSIHILLHSDTHTHNIQHRKKKIISTVKWRTRVEM